MSLPGFKTLRSLLIIYYSCSLTFTEVLRSPGPVPNALRAFVPVGQGPLLSGSRGCGDGDLGGGWGLRGHAAGERQSRAANPGQRESRAHASPPLCGPAGSASPSACPCADDPPTPSHHAASSSALSGVTRPASHFCPPVPLSSTETSLPPVTHRPGDLDFRVASSSLHLPSLDLELPAGDYRLLALFPFAAKFFKDQCGDPVLAHLLTSIRPSVLCPLTSAPPPLKWLPARPPLTSTSSSPFVGLLVFVLHPDLSFPSVHHAPPAAPPPATSCHLRLCSLF